MIRKPRSYRRQAGRQFAPAKGRIEQDQIKARFSRMGPGEPLCGIGLHTAHLMGLQSRANRLQGLHRARFTFHHRDR